jgi:hypothetical protein
MITSTLRSRDLKSSLNIFGWPRVKKNSSERSNGKMVKLPEDSASAQVLLNGLTGALDAAVAAHAASPTQRTLGALNEAQDALAGLRSAWRAREEQAGRRTQVAVQDNKG